ncbi:FixH family protein [Congregibacter variabilis]|uniref:FixH family protein n=1 Tax=Congregibacter variabilis TaxID=3081200 RepID=A0ABZ0I337_9GAMM|nr:FixH family protein [Congregibacter sp. IMCC43200]
MRTVIMPKPQRNSRWQEDEEPWYQQFWPWFLIALPGSVVIAGLSTLYIANRYSDDLVVDNYYKDGLAINKELGKQAIAQELGISAQIKVLDRRAQVRLSGKLSPENFVLRFSHPLEADRDFTVTLSEVAPGLYQTELPAELSPNWHWTMEASDSQWRLDGSLAAEDFISSAPSRP